MTTSGVGYRDGNGSDLNRILDFSFSSPFNIYILFIIRFRFFILFSTSIGYSYHTLFKYPILICEMNCFKKNMNIKNSLLYNSNENYCDVIS